MNYWILAALLLVGSSVSTAAAQNSPETDEAKFVRLSQQLEEAPLSDSDKSIRSWLLQWAINSQEITVLVCSVIPFALDDDVQNGGIFTTQMMFGNAAYQITHHDKRNDLLATQLAGVRSALKAYASILAKDPGARIPEFDDLLQKHRDGKLEAHMAPIIDKECNRSSGT